MRFSVDEYFIELAHLVSTRATCRHRQQGAVLVKDKRIISTGYNGAPSGMGHCTDIGWCAKTEGLKCRAEGLHGESNAIASAAKAGIQTDGATLYAVFSPCYACCNLLKSAGIIAVKYSKVYESFEAGPEYLKNLNIIAEQVEERGKT